MRREILDHGYVELVEAWGSDERIIEAARMSTGKGFKYWGPLTVCDSCGENWESHHKPEEWDDTGRNMLFSEGKKQ